MKLVDAIKVILNPSTEVASIEVAKTFNMRGAVIQAVVESGDKTYDLSVVNGLANCLSAMKYELKAGAASNLSLTFSPPFEIAKILIESGILGVGMPAADSHNNMQSFTMQKGVVKALSASDGQLNALGAAKVGDVVKNERGGKKDGKPQGDATAISLRAKFWYEDYGPKSVSPTFYGIMKPPQIAFGEEITITMQAVSACGEVASRQELEESYSGKSVYEILTDISKRLNVAIRWEGTSASKAKSKKYSMQLDMNLLAFINELLERIGCHALFITPEGEANEALIVRSHEDVNNSAPVCSLVMYKQIDPTNEKNPVYPLMGFETDLTHASLMGMQSGASHNSTDTNSKTTGVNRTDVDTNKRKIVGKTVNGKLRIGKKTQSGVVSGASKMTNESAGQRIKGMNRNKENDNAFDENVEYTNDAMEKAWKMVLHGPAVPWIYPMSLVRVDIGGIRHLTGVYKLIDLVHTVDGNGAETEFTVYKAIGFVDAESIGKKTNDDLPKDVEGTLVTDKPATIKKGLIEMVGEKVEQVIG